MGEVGRTRSRKLPVVAGLAALAILIPLTIPLLSLNLGQQDTAALSTSTTARQAYDLLAEELRRRGQRPAARRGLARLARAARPTTSRRRRQALERSSGSSGILGQSGVRATRATSRPAPATLQKDVAGTPDVAAVTPMQIDKAGTTAFFNAISNDGPGRERDHRPRQHAALDA